MEKDDQKDVAYFSALVNAWITSKLERDKLILTLSSGGIALLVTLLSTIGIRNCFETILYILAFISFIITIIVIIVILDENSRYIEEIISSGKKSDSKLSRLDKFTMISFICGILFAILIGGISANNKLNDYIKGEKMAEEQKTNNTSESSRPLNESFNNLGKLNTSKTTEKSLNNLGNLSPNNSGDSLNNLGNLAPAQGSSSNNSSSSNESSGGNDGSSSQNSSGGE